MPSDGFNENAFDDTVTHRLALLRYEAGTAQALLKAYDVALRDVRAEMAALAARIDAGQSLDQRRLDRLKSLGDDLRTKIRDLERILRLTLDERLTEAAEAEEAFQNDMLARNLGIDFSRVPEEAVATAVKTPLGGNVWTDRLKVDLKEQHDQIRDALAIAQAKGSSMPDIAKALKQGTSIIETYRGRLIAIARTETQRVANTVALAAYAENLDVLRGVQWLATLDSRTCLVCAPLHNKVYHYDRKGVLSEGFRAPPLHPRCRCFPSPVTKGWAELGIKVPASMRGRFDDRPATDTTFDAWLKRQGRVRQIEVFDGEARWKAWRAGKIPLSGFAEEGRVLNLGELRGRYPKAGV